MKIGIFDPYLDTMSGGERYMLSAALALSDSHDVTLFWDTSKKSQIQELAHKRLGLDITPLSFTESIFTKQTSFKKRYILSKQYDALLLLSDGSIPLVATKLFLHFQTPMEWVRQSLISRFKNRRVQAFICNSAFTKYYIDRKFGVKSKVVYPPVLIKKGYSESKKEHNILHVGRYGISGQGTSYKKQEFLTEVFSEMVTEGLQNWKMIFVMSVRESELKDAESFQKQYSSKHIEFLINPTSDKVWEEYEKASIYWHASGFGEDITLHPDRAEHFGISTVEAMGAGAVPIVYPVGGQKEIINNGENGFTFTSKDELKSQTLLLIKNSEIRKKIALKATDSADTFSQGAFSKHIRRIIA